MAANRSQRRVRHDVLEASLSTHREFLFRLYCGRCHTWRDLSVAGLIRSYGGDHATMRIVNRLRCRQCGRPPVKVILRDDRTDRELGLVGVG